MSELPKGWTATALGEISQGGIDQSGPYKDVGTFTYVDISAIDRETKRIENPQSLDVREVPSRARQRLQTGDVLVSMTRPNLNAVALVPDALEGSIGSTGFHVLRSSFISPRWVAYRVQAHDFISAMSLKVQGALYPAVRPKDIAGFPVDIPPREEQERVVAEIEKQFTRLDAATAALKRVQDNLKRYRASVLKAACEGRLVPTEASLARQEGRGYEPADKLLQRILRERRARWEADALAKMQASGKPPKGDHWKQKYKEPAVPDTTNLPPLPGGWCWASVDQLTQEAPYALAIGPFGSNLKVSDYQDQGVPLIFVRNIRSRDFDGNGNSFVLPEKARELAPHSVSGGDVLITKMGDPPGDSCVYPVGKPDAVITADCIKIRFHQYLPRHDIFVYFIESPFGKKQILQRTRGVAQLKVSLERFRDFPIPLPPVEEQGRLASAIECQSSCIDALVTDLLREFQRVGSLRQSILQSAFTGQLVPQDPTDEPASILLERIRAERTNHPRHRTARNTKQKSKTARQRGAK